jgi:uncharacterized membrane protein HdeD (DUF308 family)
MVYFLQEKTGGFPMKKEKSRAKGQKSSHLGYLLLSAILITLGVLLLVYPTESAKTVGYMIAGAAFLFGLLALVHTLSGLRRGVRFALSMIGSISTIVCAIVLVFTIDQTFSVFVSVLGLILVIDAAFKLQSVVLSHRYRQKAYWVLLVFVCLTVAGGYFCIRSELFDDSVTLLARLLGITLCLDGIGNLLSFFYLPTLRRHEKEEAAAEAKAETAVDTATQETSEHQS